MSHWTVRARLTLWTAVWFAAAVVLLGALTVSLVRKHQIETLDEQLRETARAVFHELDEHGPSGTTHTFLVVDQHTMLVVVDGKGRVLWSSPELRGEDFARALAGTQTIGSWRVLSISENGYTLRAARGFEEVEATVADVRQAYMLALPVLLLFVGVTAWWIVRSALRPVQEISAAAHRITAERLDARLPQPARRDELGQLTEVLNEMLERLDRSFRQAVRFTADASHELQTPLALTAAGISELLRRRDLAPDVVAALGSLLDDTRRLSSVCQDLLLLARADAGRLALDRQAHDLCVLIEAAVEDARILGEARGLTVSDVELPSHAPEAVDARYFTVILLNLFSNAVKYNCNGGAIRVRLRPEGTMWALDVANTGPGIGTEQQSRLFQRFFRADSSAAIPGHGLGLSLSRELARAHGGDLVFLGSGEGWTTFRLTVPRTIRRANLSASSLAEMPAITSSS